MIDLNHGSGCQYDAAAAVCRLGSAINCCHRSRRSSPATAQQPPRRLPRRHPDRRAMRAQDGVRLSRRAEGRGPRRSSRDAAHLRRRPPSSRTSSIGWLRAAGFDLRTARARRRQFGFSALAAGSRSHRRLPRRRPGVASPGRRSGSTRRSGRILEGRGQARRRRSSKPVYAAQMRSTWPISSCRTRRCSPRSTRTPGALSRARPVRRGARAGA